MAKIDFKQTAENCRLFNQSAIARECGIDQTIVSGVIKGKYPSMEGPKAQRVLAKLRELGVLAEVPDDGDVDMAA